jgi:hypothetical protein
MQISSCHTSIIKELRQQLPPTTGARLSCFGSFLLRYNKAAEDITPDYLKMFMSLLLLVKKLSTDHCDVLGNLLELWFQHFDALECWSRNHLQQIKPLSKYCRKCACQSCTEFCSKSNISTVLDPVILPPIPRNLLEIRSKIQMGTRSVFNILPHPMVQKMEDPFDKHVYVILSNCILHFLVQGIFPLEFNKLHVKYPITLLNKTPRGVEIAKSLDKIRVGKIFSCQHFNLSFLEWKDDCESAKSNWMSKSPLWIFTITIFRDGNYRNSPKSTYPVVIGPKGKSHEPVEAIIKADLVRLRIKAQTALFGLSMGERPFRCSFSAELFMSFGDQPEQRGGNLLQLGNSPNHARWRYAFDYSQLLDVTQLCPKCFDEMLKCDSFITQNNTGVDRDSWTTRKCHVCSNWM